MEETFFSSMNSALGRPRDGIGSGNSSWINTECRALFCACTGKKGITLNNHRPHLIRSVYVKLILRRSFSIGVFITLFTEKNFGETVNRLYFWADDNE
jgi:hypothetical protein